MWKCWFFHDDFETLCKHYTIHNITGHLTKCDTQNETQVLIYISIALSLSLFVFEKGNCEWVLLFVEIVW